MKTKTAVGIMIVCGAMAIGLAAAPKLVSGSVPAAKLVSVEKIEHRDSVSLTGVIVKNSASGEAYVRAYVPEQEISKVSVGQTAEITGEAFPDTEYIGTVERIADIAAAVSFGNIKKTAVEINIKIDSPDSNLKQGYTAKVKLMTSGPSTMTVLPYEAVNQDSGGEYIYILRDGKAEKLYIETGAELSEGTELKTPIPDGARIITVDELIDDGGAVRLSETEADND